MLGDAVKVQEKGIFVAPSESVPETVACCEEEA